MHEALQWNNLNIFDSAVERPTSDQFQIALFPRVIVARDDDWDLVFPELHSGSGRQRQRTGSRKAADVFSRPRLKR